MEDHKRSEYTALLESELSQLESALKRRADLKDQLEQVRVEITKHRAGAIGLAALANVDVRRTHPEVLKPECEVHFELEEAITKAFNEIDSTQGYSVNAIRDEIEDIGFPTAALRNPQASITRTLNRMVDAGKMIIATDNDTNTAVYFWADGFGAACLKRQDDEAEEMQRKYFFSAKLDEEGSVDYKHLRRIQEISGPDRLQTTTTHRNQSYREHSGGCRSRLRLPLDHARSHHKALHPDHL